MLPERTPAHPEWLPPGWGVRHLDDDEIAFRRRDPVVEVYATSDRADQTFAELGIVHAWELVLRQDVSGTPLSATVGRVTTRDDAIRVLRACMEQINERLSEGIDSFDHDPVFLDLTIADVAPDDLETGDHQDSRELRYP